MNGLAKALADPTFRGWYLVFCFAVMYLPMISLAYWYHSRVRQTHGGRELMKEQGRVGVVLGRRLSSATKNLQNAKRMANDISRGRYGATVKSIQNRTYFLVALWLTGTAIVFGILVWADEVNRAVS